jgi:hypothetical protein
MKNMPKAQFLRLPLPVVLILLLAAARPIQAGPDDANPGAGRLPSAHEANAEPGPSNQLNEPIIVPEAQWVVPESTLPHIDFKEIPVSEAAAWLRNQCSNEFDVVAPEAHTDFFNNIDERITLQLRNVTVTEVFNAMNLIFAQTKTPLRWQLMMNGKRPTALLRVLEAPKPPEAPPEAKPPPEPERPMVFFVGDLLGDPKTGGMTMDQLVKTVVEVSRIGIGGEHVFCHNEAQLIIVRGTSNDIGFVKNTLAALREKAQLEAHHNVNAAQEFMRRRAGAQPGGPVPATGAKTP